MSGVSVVAAAPFGAPVGLPAYAGAYVHVPSLAARFYPEMAVAGFSHVDGSISFYTQVAALLRPEHRLLDYGAGRGEQIIDDPSPFRRALLTFRGRCAHVEGCDVSSTVLTNPYLDHGEVIDPAKPLPYADASFDIIVSRYVFEHIDDPTFAAAELLRVVKPGGWICAVTPNGIGYTALAARLVPNLNHARALSRAQPGRKAEDVFPVCYRLNSPGALRRHFGHAADIYVYRGSAEPAYHFGNALLFRVFMLLHRLLPDAMQNQLSIFMRRRSA